MKREFYQNHSEALGKDMSMIVYGEGGYPVIVFQSQDSKSNSFEDFGMVDEIADYIEQGRIQLFSVDNNDEESWSAQGADPAWRTQRQEDYFRFVTDELVPKVHEWNNSQLRPLAIGCSMGGTHAAIAATRRPDLFQGNISLSGVYRTGYFFGDYMDERLYANDVVASLANMPQDHPYVDILNHRTLIFCVGQGAWEEGIDDLHSIDRSLDRLGIGHWCDFWGYDVNHDWNWWKKQIRYFLPIALKDIDRELAAEREASAEPAAKKTASAAKASAAKPAQASKAATTKAPASKAPQASKAAASKASTKTAAKKPAAKKATVGSTKAATSASSSSSKTAAPAPKAASSKPASSTKAATSAKKEAPATKKAVATSATATVTKAAPVKKETKAAATAKASSAVPAKAATKTATNSATKAPSTSAPAEPKASKAAATKPASATKASTAKTTPATKAPAAKKSASKTAAKKPAASRKRK